jgi:hypothetical protein
LKLVSKSEFAKIIGVSPSRVGKITDQLTLVSVEGKVKPQIDLLGIATLKYREKREQSQGETEPAQPDITPPPKITGIGSGNNPASHQPKPTTKSALEIEKLEEGNEKLRIDNEKKRGNLIPKILIKRVFSRLFSIHENQFKSLGVKITPAISAVYNDSNQQKTLEILESIGKEKDKALKSEIGKILESGEPDRILKTNGIIEDATSQILKAVQREFEKFLKNIKELGK